MTLYEVLGVKPTASLNDIKRAYRALSAQYHPDKVRGMENKFQEAKDAYEVLRDPDRRARYDRTGRTDDVKVTPAAIQNTIEQTMLVVITATREDGTTDDPTWDDIRDKIVQSLKQTRITLVNNVNTEQRKLKRCENLMRRFQSKTAEDPVGDALSAHHRRIKAELHKWQDALEINFQTEKAFLAYDYVMGEVEPEPEGQYDPDSTDRLSGPRLMLERQE